MGKTHLTNAVEELLTAVKNMSKVIIDDPRERQIVEILMGYITKEAQLIARTLGVQIEQ